MILWSVIMGLIKQWEHLQNYKHNVYKVRYTCWGSLSNRKKKTSIASRHVRQRVLIVPFQPFNTKPVNLFHFQETHNSEQTIRLPMKWLLETASSYRSWTVYLLNSLSVSFKAYTEIFNEIGHQCTPDKNVPAMLLQSWVMWQWKSLFKWSPLNTQCVISVTKGSLSQNKRLE